MKITKIERSNTRPADSQQVFAVTFEPNWLERLFGAKTKVEEYKTTNYEYRFGSGNVYVDRNGETTGNGSEITRKIDAFRRAW